MFSQCVGLEQEGEENAVQIFAIDPGMMDTALQEIARNSDFELADLMQKFIKGLQMGKQIRFFMDESDEMEFYKYITGLGGQLITQNLVEVDCDSLQENRQRKVFIRFQNSQVIAGESGRLDMLNSDVIEFVRCMKHENFLNYGRLWMSTREGNLKVKRNISY